MDINEVYSGETIKAADLQNRTVTVTIASVELKEFSGQDGKPAQKKLLIKFANTQKALVCNKTNAKAIAFLWGSETAGWIGRKIALKPEMVSFKGEPTLAVRVQPAAASAPAARAPTPRAVLPPNDPMPDSRPPQQQHENPADDIPF